MPLAKQVLSQLSYTPAAGLLFILKHFPIFCCLYPWFWASTVHVPCIYSATVLIELTTVHIRSATNGAISPARRSSFTKASRFICNFICEYFLKTCASPCRSICND